MGGKYSVCARNLKENAWGICDYNCNFFKCIYLAIKCFVKYDVVQVGKHGK